MNCYSLADVMKELRGWDLATLQSPPAIHLALTLPTSANADAFIAACRDAYHLPLAGLMCIPPAGEAPAPHFALLREIARRNGLAGLSMGMSGDYEIALGFDASLVRVGTAIFGARAPAPDRT